MGETLSFISAFLIAFNNLQYAYMKEMPQTHVHKRSDHHEDTTYQHLMFFCICQTTFHRISFFEEFIHLLFSDVVIGDNQELPCSILF